VTAHPTADWTAQQFRMIVSGDQAHRFLIHDRDTIYSEGVDRTLQAMGADGPQDAGGLTPSECFLRTRDRHNSPRMLGLHGSMSERHVRAILREWVRHDNRGRPHASLGPGIPEGSIVATVVRASDGRSVPARGRVAATPILSGVHHEYRLERHAA
jgi:hypothetical protein